MLTFHSPEDSEYEVKNMSEGVGELDVYPSIWGYVQIPFMIESGTDNSSRHWAGGPPGNMDDVKWLDERLAKYFTDSPERKELAMR